MNRSVTFSSRYSGRLYQADDAAVSFISPGNRVYRSSTDDKQVLKRQSILFQNDCLRRVKPFTDGAYSRADSALYFSISYDDVDRHDFSRAWVK